MRRLAFRVNTICEVRNIRFRNCWMAFGSTRSGVNHLGTPTLWLVAIPATVWQVHDGILLCPASLRISTLSWLVNKVSPSYNLIPRHRCVRQIDSRVVILVHRSYFLTEISGFHGLLLPGVLRLDVTNEIRVVKKLPILLNYLHRFIHVLLSFVLLVHSLLPCSVVGCIVHVGHYNNY